MKRRASRIYQEPTGSFFFMAAIVAGAAVAAYYVGRNEPGVSPVGFNSKRWHPFWNVDGTINPVASLYSNNQLFNVWTGNQ